MTDEKDENKDEHTSDPNLLEPYRYINAIPGKDIRGKLIDCFQLWLHVPEEQDIEKESTILKDIKQIIADLHNASLLIDDVEDNSKMRRGVPVAHSIFGVPSVLNCANYVYFFALERCYKLNNSSAMQVFVMEMLNLHRGQGHDILWRDTSTCPTEEEYCNMVLDKTGGLFRLAVGLMQAFATENKTINYTPLLNKLSLYFQIRDDLINLADPEYMKNKSFCEDLTEGKYSFPILHCIKKEMEDGDTRLSSILKQRTDDPDVKKYAQLLMRNAGSLEYARDKCIVLHDEIVVLIDGFGGNNSLLKVMEFLQKDVEKLKDTVKPLTP